MLLASTVYAEHADSFFDVWTEISFDRVSDRPIVSGKASISSPGEEGSSTVDIHIESMNLMSHGPSGGPSKHIATIMYSVSNIGSSGEDGVGFMEVVMTCTGTKEVDSCGVDSSTPISRADFRGHVTVLK